MNAWYRPASSTFGYLYADIARVVSTAARQDWSFPPLRAPHPAARFKRSLIIGRKFYLDAIGATFFFFIWRCVRYFIKPHWVDCWTRAAIFIGTYSPIYRFQLRNRHLVIYRDRLWIQMLHCDSDSSVRYCRLRHHNATQQDRPICVNYCSVCTFFS